MTKLEELSNPNSCMSRAREDELTFVLLERDPAAPAAIRAWAGERVRIGKNLACDAQITEALLVADLMDWRNKAALARDTQEMLQEGEGPELED